jgi:hypothetical protein
VKHNMRKIIASLALLVSLMGFTSLAQANATYTLGGHDSLSQTSSVFSFSSETFNTSASDVPVVTILWDEILVAINSSGTPSFSVSIGGTLATCFSAPSAHDDKGNLIPTAFGTATCYISPTALTTTSVVVNTNSLYSSLAPPAFVFITTGKVTTTTPTPYSHNSALSLAAPSISMTTNIPSGGIGIAAIGLYRISKIVGGSTFTGSVTFSGSSNDPSGDNQFNIALGEGDFLATAHTTTVGTPSTITVTGFGCPGYPAWEMVSWGP